MPVRPALLFTVGVLLMAVFPLVLVIVVPPSGTAGGYPIEVVSFNMGGIQSPGGPTLTLTVLNVGAEPIVNLSGTLVMDQHAFPFSFADVSSGSPLVPDGSAQATLNLIGAGFTCGDDYPLQLVGENATGTSFWVALEPRITCSGP